MIAYVLLGLCVGMLSHYWLVVHRKHPSLSCTLLGRIPEAGVLAGRQCIGGI